MSIIGEFNELLDEIRKYLVNWLNLRLPYLGKTWWEDCVISNLNDYQLRIVEEKRANSLEQLDLSILLKITKKNWMELVDYSSYKSSDYFTVKDMIGVRNTWSHCSVLPSNSDILSQLNTMIKFASLLEADKEFIKRLQEKKKEYLSGSGRISESNQVISGSKLTTEKTENEIRIGSIVAILSEGNKTGAVLSKTAVGSKTLYSVFVNGVVREYLEEQISASVQNEGYKPADIRDLFSRLTALQISLPSANGLYSLNSSKINFYPYQFKPALKIIKSERPRLLLADSVGVGKTIEAGLILHEMEARATLNTVVIVCPKPLISERKWESEMRDRFDESFKPINGNALHEIVNTLDRDEGDWPDDYSRAIIPYSILTKEILEGSSNGKRTNLGFEDLDNPPHIDLLIIDEAHHVRNQDTAVYKAVRYLCQHAEAIIMLTATPLQMGDHDLYTLLNLLNPEIVIDEKTFALMAEPNTFINESLRIQRSRLPNWSDKALKSLKKITGTEWGKSVISKTPEYLKVIEKLSMTNISDEIRLELISQTEELNSFSSMINRTRRRDIQEFCIRRPVSLDPSFTAYQQELYDALLEFESRVLSILHNPESINFMTCQMKRQAASCIFGLAPFIEDIVEKRLNQLMLDEIDSDEDVNIGIEEYRVIKEQANKLLELAAALPVDDYKYDELLKIIMDKQKEENNKIILFSSFRHTLRYIGQKLKDTGLRYAQIDGSVDNDERYDISQRFKLERDNVEAYDILLFTDVGSEGLDYQFCDMIINYDLPWNPMKIEQRIGRIDRHGQKNSIIRIVNIITKGTIDYAIYDRCLRRIGIFENNIGDCEKILGNVYKDIKDVMLSSKLTEDEKKEKIEQEADNVISEVMAIKQLREDEDQFFGFDIANSAMTRELNNSDNTWISPVFIHNLVSRYLEKRLGCGNYLIGDKEIKNLRLSADARVKLYEEDFKKTQSFKNDVLNKWRWYLRGSKPDLAVTFNNDAAKDNQNAVLLNVVHPLVQKAAETLRIDEPMFAFFSMPSGDYGPGTYPFIIYTWTYTGSREKTKTTAVCTEPFIEKEVFDVIQSVRMTEKNTSMFNESWNNLKEKQLSLFERERLSYKYEVSAKVLAKKTSLKNYYFRLEEEINRNIDNNLKSSKYVKSMQGRLLRYQSECKSKLEKLDQELVVADIVQKPLLYGVIEVS